MISYNEYSAVVNKVVGDVFSGNMYHPEVCDFSFRLAVISVFTDCDLSVYEEENSSNKLFEYVFSKEASEILDKVKKTSSLIYDSLENAVLEAVEHRKKMLESSPMSLTDYALSNLVELLGNKIDEVDMAQFNNEDIKNIATATAKMTDGEFANYAVEALEKKGYLSKPNRVTRRKNIKTTKD